MVINFKQLKGKTIRLLDVGSGTGNSITKKAIKNPNGIYAAVDPAYAGHPVNPATREFLRPMREAGVVIRGTTIQKYLKTMQKNKIKTRTINATLPNWKSPSQNYIHDLIELAPRVLLPNGRIFMTIERTTFEKASIQREFEFAKIIGFKVDAINLPSGSHLKTHSANAFNDVYGTSLKLIIFTLKSKIKK